MHVCSFHIRIYSAIYSMNAVGAQKKNNILNSEKIRFISLHYIITYVQTRPNVLVCYSYIMCNILYIHYWLSGATFPNYPRGHWILSVFKRDTSRCNIVLLNTSIHNKLDYIIMPDIYRAYYVVTIIANMYAYLTIYTVKQYTQKQR